MNLLAKNWWTLVIRGIIAILLAGITFAWPGITLTALVFLFAGYALVDGALSIAGAVRAAERHERWITLALEGLVGIAAAVLTAIWPGITLLALIYVVAAWALITGVLEIATAIRLRKQITGEWLMILSGIFSIIFGLLVAIVPLAGALVLAIWFGAYMLVFGSLMVVLGFRLRYMLHGGTRAIPMDMRPLPR